MKPALACRHLGNIQQPMPGAPPFVPPAFPGMPPPFMRPPPGMAPPPGFQMPGMPPLAGSGVDLVSKHGSLTSVTLLCTCS